MTNQEAAKSSVGSNYPFDDEAFKVGLTSVGLDPEAEFAPGKAYDLAIAQLILYLITAADIREGGYAVNLDRDAMFRVRKALLDKWDSTIPDGPVIRNRTYMW